MRSLTILGVLVVASCTDGGTLPDASITASALGETCGRDADCAPGLRCFLDAPGGECSQLCSSDTTCGANGVCRGGRCHPSCVRQADCSRGAPFHCFDPPSGYCSWEPLTPQADLKASIDLASAVDLALAPPPDYAIAWDLFFDPAQCGAWPDFAPPPSCFDRIKNQDESDVDCGGSRCPKCADASACSAPTDCTSGQCTNARCQGCEDGIANQGESDVDCGGKLCAPCHIGRICTVAADCLGGLCSGGRCALATTCANGKFDGQETDVDCGGPCAPCPTDKHCKTRLDCSTDPCSQGVCTSCSNQILDGDETDVDCGGPCGKCADYSYCTANADCASGLCSQKAVFWGSYRYCDPTTCHNGRLDGNETDVDCGGRCLRCKDCQVCNADDDCLSQRCVGHRCAPGDCRLPGCWNGVTEPCDATSCDACCTTAASGYCGLDMDICPPTPDVAWCDTFHVGASNFLWACTPHGWANRCPFTVTPGGQDLSCNGCCTGDQGDLFCAPGDTNAACGYWWNGGERCSVCPSGTQCKNHVCTPL